MVIGIYGQAIKDTVPGRMVPCDEQGTKGESVFLTNQDCAMFVELLKEVKDPGSQDLLLLLPPERGLGRGLCNPRIH